MTHEQYGQWLDSYKAAWERRDPDAAVSLFTDEATYHEKPFDAPIAGRDAIREYWQGAADTQQDIVFQYNILSLNGQVGVNHWSASFTRVASGQRVQLDGIMVITFNENAFCTEFREWWHRDETESA